MVLSSGSGPARALTSEPTTIVQGIVQRAEATETRLRNFVIDCEVVAIDPVSGAFKTFQELSCKSRVIDRSYFHVR